MSVQHRIIRRELDRLAGELVRRQQETDACLALYARREALRAVSKRMPAWRGTLALVAWFMS